MTLGDGDQESDKVLLSPREPGAWGSVSAGTRHRDKTKSLKVVAIVYQVLNIFTVWPFICFPDLSIRKVQP